MIQVSFCREIKMGQHVLERTDLPDELITKVSGVTIFEQELPRVCLSLQSTFVVTQFIYLHHSQSSAPILIR